MYDSPVVRAKKELKKCIQIHELKFTRYFVLLGHSDETAKQLAQTRVKNFVDKLIKRMRELEALGYGRWTDTPKHLRVF